MILVWIGLALMLVPGLVLVGGLLYVHSRVLVLYVPRISRIFQEKPLFIVPRGQPIPDAEVVRFTTADGITLNGCYLRANAPRRGVILFGLEFGSNCWSCYQYCEHLLGAGYDVFAFEQRGQGESSNKPDYEPLQWVTEYEVFDTQAAIAYLKSRPDADPRGVGLFGISKGAGAGLLVAAADPYIRCCVTDGAFGTGSTVVRYMRQWLAIYNKNVPQVLIPDWYYSYLCRIALREIERERGCRFPPLEKALPKLAPRPLLIIHGEQDTYIKPELAKELYELAGPQKSLWIVENAKHNQALHVAFGEYRRRVLAFFEAALA